MFTRDISDLQIFRYRVLVTLLYPLKLRRLPDGVRGQKNSTFGAYKFNFVSHTFYLFYELLRNFILLRKFIYAIKESNSFVSKTLHVIVY